MKESQPHDYKVILSDISEGDQKGFSAYVPALNAHCFGDTPTEALESYYIYFEDEVERRKKEGIPMPEPDTKEQKMKQVPLRLPQNVYEQAMIMAKNRRMSFNAFVTDMLTVAGS